MSRYDEIDRLYDEGFDMEDLATPHRRYRDEPNQRRFCTCTQCRERLFRGVDYTVESAVMLCRRCMSAAVAQSINSNL